MSRNRYLNYGYDEFGNDLGNDLGRELNESGIPNPYDRQGVEQPFGYTGYRYDEISGTYFAQAREYQPQYGRFTAEDVIKGNIAVSETLHYYNYCWSNPLRFVDINGKWPDEIENLIKIIDEKVQNYRNELSKKNGTYSEGFNISGTPNIWQFDGMICFSRDYKGNMGIQITGSGGVTVGTPSISISKYVSRTNAPDISFLEGSGVSIGGSALVQTPVVVSVGAGGEFNIIGDVNSDSELYYGVTVNAGAGIGVGGEGHIEWGETKTIFKINIFDIWDDIYKNIMGGEEENNNEKLE